MSAPQEATITPPPKFVPATVPQLALPPISKPPNLSGAQLTTK